MDFRTRNIPMPTEQDLTRYLQEHVSSELLMLRYTISELDRALHPLDWNAKFESAVVHIRDLYGFLSSSDGNQNIAATDYVAGFETDRPRELEGLRFKANPQVFHLGKQRLDAVKLSKENAQKAHGWIEANMKKLIASLPARYATAWALEDADPNSLAVRHLSGAKLSQSSQPIVMQSQTDTTSLQVLTDFRVSEDR